jgi:hypothetical protein
MIREGVGQPYPHFAKHQSRSWFQMGSVSELLCV